VTVINYFYRVIIRTLLTGLPGCGSQWPKMAHTGKNGTGGGNICTAWCIL